MASLHTDTKVHKEALELTLGHETNQSGAKQSPRGLPAAAALRRHRLAAAATGRRLLRIPWDWGLNPSSGVQGLAGTRRDI